jgi:hypothetical protein
MPPAKKQAPPALPPEKKKESFSYHKGWDSFMPDADTVDHVACKVCGSKCDVKRNVSGPRSFVEAMGQKAGQEMRKDNPHDHFFCPNAGFPWHDQALAILMEALHTSSAVLTKMLQDEAKQLVLSKHTTKEHWLP